MLYLVFFSMGFTLALVLLKALDQIALPSLSDFLSPKSLVQLVTPLVLNKLDPLMPSLLQTKSGEALKDYCMDLIQEVTEKLSTPAKPKDIEAVLKNVVRSYSFIVNASKLNV